MDYFETRRRQLEAVLLAAVREAVRDPATMKAVVVGDLASIRGSLLALGWGPIERRDAEGNFVEVISR